MVQTLIDETFNKFTNIVKTRPRLGRRPRTAPAGQNPGGRLGGLRRWPHPLRQKRARRGFRGRTGQFRHRRPARQNPDPHSEAPTWSSIACLLISAPCSPASSARPNPPPSRWIWDSICPSSRPACFISSPRPSFPTEVGRTPRGFLPNPVASAPGNCFL